MDIITSVEKMQEHCRTLKLSNKSIAFVPTMGNLHEGHIALVKEAINRAEVVIVSIFVNPSQFGKNEDFGTYPRTLDADLTKLNSLDVDCVFTPTSTSLYPFGTESFTQVVCPNLDKVLCSLSRPHFFTGVATVVTKLLNITQPNFAIFGEKDFQQLSVIKRICNELFIPTKIISFPTVREQSGLAMSSRNGYLSEEEKELAANLYKVLCQTRLDIINKREKLNNPNYIASLEEHAKIALTEYGFTIDYFEIMNARELNKNINFSTSEIVIALACVLNRTRLIDNILVSI